MKKCLILFITMLKIGLFTFGGGYAMIALLENEFVIKKKYLDNDEFMDMVAIAESTPGPIAINAATYIGYKVCGVLGAIACTIGVCIPSFVIIYVISLFFNQFLEIEWVAKAFKGVQIGVIFLIASSGVKMLIKLPKTVFNIIVAIITFGCVLAFSVFAINFSAIFYILASGALGLLVYAIGYFYKKFRSQKQCVAADVLPPCDGGGGQPDANGCESAPQEDTAPPCVQANEERTEGE